MPTVHFDPAAETFIKPTIETFTISVVDRFLIKRRCKTLKLKEDCHISSTFILIFKSVSCLLVLDSGCH